MDFKEFIQGYPGYVLVLPESKRFAVLTVLTETGRAAFWSSPLADADPPSHTWPRAGGKH